MEEHDALVQHLVDQRYLLKLHEESLWGDVADAFRLELITGDEVAFIWGCGRTTAFKRLRHSGALERG